MKQTGRFFTLYNDNDGNPKDRPVKNLFLFFNQGGVRKVETKTNDNGEFDFDLPIGSYTIQINQGAGFDILDLFAGVPFELTAESSQTALNDWLMNPVASGVDSNPIVTRMLAIQLQVSEYAVDAKSSATEAQQIQQQMQSNSIGDANGKFIKQGASKSDFLNTFGKYYSQDNMPSLVAGDTGLSYSKHFKTNNIGLDFANTGIGENEFLYYEAQRNYADTKATIIEFKGYRGRSIYAQSYRRADGVWTKPVVFYNQENTTVDSNGFIKKASPIIKLFDDHIEWNHDFKEEPIFEKIDIGVYKISNTRGLARGIVHGDWYIETPKNRNGLPYFMVEWEQDAITDDVVIKVFDRKFDINIGDFVNGEPRDIGKDERWIDLRFHEQVYSLTNELPDINVPYHELWGVDPYIPQVVEQTEEDIALEDQRAF